MAFAAEAKDFGRPAETKALTRPMHPSRARAAGESPLRVRQTPSAFPPRAQQTLSAVAFTARTSGRRSKFDAFVHEIGDTIETGKLLVVFPIELLGGKINE